jgi:hypothetical protein
MGHKQGNPPITTTITTFSQFVGVLREELSKQFYYWINMTIKELGLFLFPILNENRWKMSYDTSPTNQFSIKDDFYDVKAIEETAKTGNLPNPTRTLGGWQIFDYILLPYYFIEIEL